MRIQNVITVTCISLLFASCNSQNPAVKNLDAAQFDAAISKGKVQLIDVRTPEEYKEKHIADADNININSSDFNQRVNALDKSKPVYFYCLMGSRSSKAANYAAGNGFTEVYNLDKGITGWMAANKPVTTETGAAPSGGLSFDDYLAHIKRPDKLVLVDFNAVWCGPCKLLKPIVEKEAEKNQATVELWPVDIDKNPEIAKTMNITGIPLLILYKQGKEVWRNLGMTNETQIENQIVRFSK